MQLPEPTDKMDQWLQSYGIQFNPFDDRLFDAGSDPHLSTYLVGHDDFETLHRNQHTFVFAPVGGGKSAFRVRLARACRVREDGRALFSITYKLPRPHSSDKAERSLDSHLARINEAIAKELFLTLAYRPDVYLDLASPVDQRQVQAFLHEILQGNLKLYLQQLDSQHTVRTLIKKFDPTAEHLFSLPDRSTLQTLCERLADTDDLPLPTAPADPLDCFEKAIKMLREVLGYEAIYLLVDGIDAFIETVNTPSRAMTELRPLLCEMAGWAHKNFYVKYFLPVELISKIDFEDLHYSGGIINLSSIRIQWTPRLLKEMIQARMLAASENRYDSLAAICTSELEDIDNRLIEMARLPLPREVLVLANRVLWEHVQRVSEPDVIEQVDLQNTQTWYEEENLT